MFPKCLLLPFVLPDENIEGFNMFGHWYNLKPCLYVDYASKIIGTVPNQHYIIK